MSTLDPPTRALVRLAAAIATGEAPAHHWREAVGRPAAAVEATGDDGPQVNWSERGEATCRVVYGANYEKLRDNVRRLHPALDDWMVAEGYGRTLGRPGLDLVRRELCVIAQVTVLEAEPQLRSHLRGALNAGAASALIDQVFTALADDLVPAALTKAADLWSRLR